MENTTAPTPLPIGDSVRGKSGYQPPTDLKSRLAASYDIIAPEYNAWTVKHSSDTRLTWLNRLLAQLPSSKLRNDRVDILELGAGAGIPTTETLLEHDPVIHVLANDLSTHQLGLLRANLAAHADRVKTVEGDMLSLTPAPGSLAAVVAMYSIIHLPRAEQSLLVSKIHDWLQPGGVFLANFSTDKCEESIEQDWIGEGGWMYWSGWGVEKTKSLIEEAGFEIRHDEVVHDVVDADFWWVLARRKSL